jgi:hypothetical protein
VGFEALAESRAPRWSWVDGNAQREPALLLYAKAAPGAETTEVEKRITRRQPQTNKTLKEIVLEGLELRGGFRAVVVEEGGQSKEVLPAVPYGDVAVKKAAAAAKKLAEADVPRAARRAPKAKPKRKPVEGKAGPVAKKMKATI